MATKEDPAQDITELVKSLRTYASKDVARQLRLINNPTDWEKNAFTILEAYAPYLHIFIAGEQQEILGRLHQESVVLRRLNVVLIVLTVVLIFLTAALLVHKPG